MDSNFWQQAWQLVKSCYQIITSKKVDEISIEVVLTFTSMHECLGWLDVIQSIFSELLLDRLPNKERNGELSAEGIAAELMFG